MFNKAASTFKITIAIINSIAIVMFFDKICKTIFNYLFTAGFSEGGLFGPLSIYFGILEINGRGIFYFYYLI